VQNISHNVCNKNAVAKRTINNQSYVSEAIVHFTFLLLLSAVCSLTGKHITNESVSIIACDYYEKQILKHKEYRIDEAHQSKRTSKSDD